MDIDSNNNNDNNNSNEEKEEEVKLNLEEYGLPKEVDTKCDQELLVINKNLIT